VVTGRCPARSRLRRRVRRRASDGDDDLPACFARADGSTGFGNEKYTSGILGVIALVLIIQLKVNALEAGGETRNVSLVVAPTLARWSIVILLYGMASTVERSAVLSGRLPAIHLVVTTFFVLTLTTLIAGTTGLWIALWVSVLALMVRTFGYWRKAQLSQDHVGALVEMSEALSLVAFATL
jgi:cobalamin synthase